MRPDARGNVGASPDVGLFAGGIDVGVYEPVSYYYRHCGIFTGVRNADSMGVAFCLYRVLREDFDEPLAYGMGLLYFMLSPKDYALPDFGNQQLWYTTLLLCGLLLYLKKGKLHYLLGGYFHCVWWL